MKPQPVALLIPAALAACLLQPACQDADEGGGDTGGDVAAEVDGDVGGDPGGEVDSDGEPDVAGDADADAVAEADADADPDEVGDTADAETTAEADADGADGEDVPATCDDSYRGATCASAISIPLIGSTVEMGDDTNNGCNAFPGAITCGGDTPFDGRELYYSASSFTTVGCEFVPSFDAEVYVLSADGCTTAESAEAECAAGTDHAHVAAGTSHGFGWSYGGHYIIVIDSIGPGGTFQLSCIGWMDPDVP